METAEIFIGGVRCGFAHLLKVNKFVRFVREKTRGNLNRALLIGF